MGWLRATPKYPKDYKGDKKTRIATRIDKGLSEGYAPINEEYKFMIDWWKELGMFSDLGNGPCPLTFQEVKAWAELTGSKLTSWRSRLLVKMSQQYCALLRTSDGKDMSPPHKIEVTEEEMQTVRNEVANKISSMF